VTSIAAQERRHLTTLVRQVGPEAPTLCAGWTVRDLVAHLVVREASPTALGVAVPAVRGAYERERVRRTADDFTELVDRLRNGPPLLSVFSLPWADRVLNGTEFFIHHEDVRRAQPGWEPRALAIQVQDALWKALQVAGRLAVVRAPVGVVAERADSGERTTLKGGEPHVVVCGAPAEVMLFLHGRRDHAQVELLGDEVALAGLRATRLGV
jgi:uncharacterized protein (TIGR03085 family)